MPLRFFVVIALAFLAGAGCGRRGALEDPAAAAADPTLDSPSRLGAISPGAQDPRPVRPGPAAPPRRFVLDPLI